MAMYARPRKTCGSISDIKIICNTCGGKLFVARAQLSGQDGHELDVCCIHPGCAGNHQTIDLSEEKEWYGTPPKPRIFDLVYSRYGGEEMDLLRGRYPDAVFRDGSDYIHPERFEIEMEGVTRKDYYLFLARTGIAAVSLNFRLDLGMPHRRDLMLEIAREIKESRPV